MPYLGNAPAERYTSMTKQTITGDGGASYTLDHAVGSEQEVEIFVNNVRQEPVTAYTVDGTALTMTGNVSADDDFYVVFQGKALGTVTPPDLSVTTARLADDAVTSAKVADAAIGKDALATNIAARWYGELSSDTTITRATNTTITSMTADEIDTHSAFDGSTFTVPSGQAGTYYIEGNIAHDFGDVGSDGEQVTAAILVNSTHVKTHNWLITGSDIYRASTQVSMMVTLSANDTVNLSVYHYDANGGNGKIKAGKTHFLGFRLI